MLRLSSVAAAAALVALLAAAPALATPPGANGKLALVVYEQDRSAETGMRLAFVQPDGSGYVQPGGGGMSPIWAPDGSRVVLMSPEFGGVRIFSAAGAPLEGGGGGGEGFHVRPTSFLPDGRLLLIGYNPCCPTTPGAREGLYTGPLEGPYAFWEDAPITDAAFVSPDGTRLAYLRDDELRVVDVDGTGDRAVATVSGPVWAWDMSWSPDSTRLAYAGRPGDLFVVAVDGGAAPVALAPSPAFDSSPSWSPDGTQIAFASDREGGHPDAWRAPVSGGAPVRVTQTAPPFSVSSVAWQPLPQPSGNRPPSCAGVTISEDTLKPRTSAYGEVTLSGATDPDGDRLGWQITKVLQDEPVGKHGPDAVRTAWSRTVALRRERSGTGDGRVYRIHFTVTDRHGASCSGSVTVSIPKGSVAARDSGARYDSFAGQPRKKRR